MRLHRYSRRAALRAGVGALATGAVSGVSGCLGLSELQGGAGGASEYQRWLPAPKSWRAGTAGPYGFRVTQAEQLRSNDITQVSVNDQIGSLLRRLVPVSIRTRAVEFSLALNLSYVLAVDFEQERSERSKIAADMEADGWATATTVNDIPIYTKDGEGTAIGLGDGQLVIGRSPIGDELEAAQGLIQAAEGNINRYQQVNQDLNRLLEGIDAAPHVVASVLPSPVSESNAEPSQGLVVGSVGRGVQFTLNGATAEVQHYVLFADREAANTDALSQWVTQSEAPAPYGFANHDDVSYSVDGRLVRITGTVPVSTLEFQI